MACWTYFTFASNMIAQIEVGLNTVTDPELKKLFQEGLNVVESHKKELSEFMRKEGVPLSETPERKPESNPNHIPLGAKFTDNELINTINLNFILAADMCAASASQCLRTDAALMFLKFQTKKIVPWIKIKRINAEERMVKNSTVL